MAGVTTSLVALGGLGMSAAQYVNATKKQKAAEKAATQAMADLKSIKETNPFSTTQIPTLGFELAQQSQQQQMSQAVDYLSSLGAAGAGMIPALTENQNEQQLRLASQANELQYQRDMAEAQAQQNINARQADRQFYVNYTEAQGAQAAALEARQQKQAAIQGAFGSLTSGLNAIDLKAYRLNKGSNQQGQQQIMGQDGVMGQGFKDQNVLDNIYGGNTELMNLSESASSRGLKPYYEWVKDAPQGSEADLMSMYKDYVWGGMEPSSAQTVNTSLNDAKGKVNDAVNSTNIKPVIDVNTGQPVQNIIDIGSSEKQIPIKEWQRSMDGKSIYNPVTGRWETLRHLY